RWFRTRSSSRSRECPSCPPGARRPPPPRRPCWDPWRSPPATRSPSRSRAGCAAPGRASPRGPRTTPAWTRRLPASAAAAGRACPGSLGRTLLLPALAHALGHHVAPPLPVDEHVRAMPPDLAVAGGPLGPGARLVPVDVTRLQLAERKLGERVPRAQP